MKVLLFKTSVKYIHEVEEVREALNKLLQGDRWSFDLDDCDHVLRIVSDRVQPAQVVEVLNQSGFTCEAWIE